MGLGPCHPVSISRPPFFLGLPWALRGGKGPRHLACGSYGSRLFLGDLGWAGGSMKISLWWSAWQSLSVPDPGWEHKSPWLARLSISHSRPACPRPQAHSGPLPSRPSPGVRPGPPFTLRTCPSAVLQRAGDEGRPSPGLGQPHPRHPRGSKYYITAGCAVRDLRQAPGLKFPEMEFAYCSPHPKNSIKKNNRKNVVRRGPARVVYLAAAVPLRSAVIGSA